MVKPPFSEKACFFQLFSRIKVELVDEMMESAYLCVILHAMPKKLPFIEIFSNSW